MKKVLISSVLAALVLTGCGATEEVAPAEAPKGMRDGAPVAVTLSAQDAAVYPKKTPLIERNWEGQPPVIPHDYKKSVNLKKNSCLMCHKPAKPGKKAKATPTHASHYDADGKLDNLFYNCHQCHVAVSDGPAAIGSNF
ncbi:nitrate reductase cytochrome c-type subunit [Ferrimonas lipolytica]|uniref:Periplasmic nitrate reductase, electron transfer subunit n=1 Tax=Ferrimonas lipolytica TaxID=2724191 RepID=A0A6H1UFU2_9GAMM|nr:nitrate reductase cytochrome c-type subunit [Ferrimonas lipolytica]QIZ77470.1 nitrate reductase cytochrome c-type subunit; periplasmic nitrate reductase electron transfer subunit [Ferrimonas lipolytica]